MSNDRCPYYAIVTLSCLPTSKYLFAGVRLASAIFLQLRDKFPSNSSIVHVLSITPGDMLKILTIGPS